MERLTEQDERVVEAQLQRPPRGLLGVARRCPCGLPAAVATAPRLPDGTPFPTMYYLTCRRLNAALSTLESQGFMREQAAVLEADQDAAADYRAAHARYIEERAAVEDVPVIAGVSAGGMPDRVKCLHALVAQSLASGPGVNPVGDAALDDIGPWWEPGPCVETAPHGPDESRRSHAGRSD